MEQRSPTTLTAAGGFGQLPSNWPASMVCFELRTRYAWIKHESEEEGTEDTRHEGHLVWFLQVSGLTIVSSLSPHAYLTWKLPKYAGLFVILAKDANSAPKPYQALYFGEFGNNTPEALLSVNYALPRREGDATLFISAHAFFHHHSTVGTP